MSVISEELHDALYALRTLFAEEANYDEEKLNRPEIKKADKAIQAYRDLAFNKPMPERTARIGDMGEGLKLELFRDGDGDIYACVMPVKHRFTDMCVEFCTPGHGGGKSPATFAALQALMRAMEEDDINHKTAMVPR